MKLLREISIKYYWLYVLLTPVIFIYRFFRYYIVPDRFVISKKYFKKFSYKLDLSNPQSFQEKLQWLKLNDRNHFYTRCADKIEVRNVIKEILCTDKYLIPIHFITSDFNDLTKDNMPSTPFVIKCNHDNNSYKIIFDKENEDWDYLRRYYRTRLNGLSLYWSNREWPYKNIIPKVMVEELLISSNDVYRLQEYKFHYFNKKLAIIDMYQVDFNGNKTARILNSRFEPYPEAYSMGYPKPIKNLYLPVDSLQKEMLEITQSIANNFSYQIRIDIYHINSKIYIGELTFFDGAGYDVITPKDWALELGSMLKLPID